MIFDFKDNVKGYKFWLFNFFKTSQAEISLEFLICFCYASQRCPVIDDAANGKRIKSSKIRKKKNKLPFFAQYFL